MVVVAYIKGHLGEITFFFKLARRHPLLKLSYDISLPEIIFFISVCIDALNFKLQAFLKLKVTLNRLGHTSIYIPGISSIQNVT